MSGILKHRTFIVPESSAQDAAKTYWYNISDFFDNHGGYTRIASYYGNGGTGFQSSTGSFPSGLNRWAVWNNTAGDGWTVWLGITESDVANKSYLDPSGSWSLTTVDNSSDSGVAFIAAWHSSSTAWNGTTNNNGNDQFNHLTMWKSNSVIHPCSSTRYGLGFPSKSIAVAATNIITQNTGSIVADDESFALITTDGYFSFEKFIPKSSSIDLPYISLNWKQTNTETLSAFSIQDVTTFGALSLKKQNSFSINGMSESYGFATYIPSQYYDTAFSITGVYPPNSTTIEHYEVPYAVFLNDFKKQYVGYTSFSRMPSPRFMLGNILGSGSRIIYFSNNTNNSPYVSIPWSSSFTPITGSGFNNTFYSQSLTFLTSGSFFHLSQSNFRETIVENSGGSGPETIYRGFLGGIYYYSTTNPPIAGATNITIVRR